MVGKGEVYCINLQEKKGTSVKAFARPAVVVQDDLGNKSSPVTVVVVATRTIREKIYPWDVVVSEDCCLDVPCRIMCNQILTIPQSELSDKIGKLPYSIMKKVDDAIRINLGL